MVLAIATTSAQTTQPLSFKPPAPPVPFAVEFWSELAQPGVDAIFKRHRIYFDGVCISVESWNTPKPEKPDERDVLYVRHVVTPVQTESLWILRRRGETRLEGYVSGPTEETKAMQFGIDELPLLMIAGYDIGKQQPWTRLPTNHQLLSSGTTQDQNAARTLQRYVPKRAVVKHHVWLEITSEQSSGRLIRVHSTPVPADESSPAAFQPLKTLSATEFQTIDGYSIPMKAIEISGTNAKHPGTPVRDATDLKVTRKVTNTALWWQFPKATDLKDQFSIAFPPGCEMSIDGTRPFDIPLDSQPQRFTLPAK
jgi:hypothetical protein